MFTCEKKEMNFIGDSFEDFTEYDMSFIGIDSDYLKNYLFFNYSMRKYFIPPFFKQNGGEYVKFRWNTFKNIRENDFQRIKTALESEYNPVENYDRSENTTITNSGSDTTRNAGFNDKITYDISETSEGTSDKIEYDSTNTETKDITTKYDNTDTKGGQDTTTDVTEKSGFNNPDSTYVTEKVTDTVSYNSNISSDSTTKDTGTDSYKNTGSDTHTVDLTNGKNGTENHEIDTTNTLEHGHIVNTEGHVHGNIGVTTNQQMIQSEIDLRIKSNLVKMIIHDFVSEFTFY